MKEAKEVFDESLKSHIPQKESYDDIREMNKKEIAKMEKMFNLPPVSGESIEQKIKNMKGFLKTYSEHDPDPVELLLDMRNYG